MLWFAAGDIQRHHPVFIRGKKTSMTGPKSKELPFTWQVPMGEILDISQLKTLLFNRVRLGWGQLKHTHLQIHALPGNDRRLAMKIGDRI